LIIDNTAPSPVTILAPVSGSFVNTGTVSVTGTGEAGATVTVTDGTTSHSTVVDGSGNWSVVFTALSDGPVTFTASQTDLAGNTSASSSTTIIVDTIAPVLIFTDDIVAGPIGSDTFVISITDIHQYNTGSYILTSSTTCDATTNFAAATGVVAGDVVVL
jgi:hypothetical protein